MTRVTQENIINAHQSTPNAFKYNHDAVAAQLRAAILADFKEQLTETFMSQAKEAVDDAVNTIMKNVEGDLQVGIDARTAKSIFNIRFTVDDRNF